MCCLAQEDDQNIYEIRAAGKSSSVQWLMTAPGDSGFLVTVKGRASDNAFNVLAYQDMTKVGCAKYQALVGRYMGHKDNVMLSHASTDTPQKRLDSLKDAVPLADTPAPFNKRRRFE